MLPRAYLLTAKPQSSPEQRRFPPCAGFWRSCKDDPYCFLTLLQTQGEGGWYRGHECLTAGGERGSSPMETQGKAGEEHGVGGKGTRQGGGGSMKCVVRVPPLPCPAAGTDRSPEESFASVPDLPCTSGLGWQRKPEAPSPPSFSELALPTCKAGSYSCYVV